MIIVRYIKKEIFNTLLAVTAMLMVVFIFQQFISYTRSATSGLLTMRTLGLLLSLQVPVLLSMLLPLSLYLGVMLALSRLYADNEMVILSVCGMSRKSLFNIVGGFALIIVLVVGTLSLWIAPHTQSYSSRLFALNKASALQLLQPGRFSSIAHNKWVFYVSSAEDEGKVLHDVFAAEAPVVGEKGKAGTPWGVLFAKEGHQYVDPDNGQTFLVLADGNRYSGSPGQRAYKKASFGEYGIRLDPPNKIGRVKEKTIPTKKLWAGRDKLNYLAELHWRLAMPIMAMILTLFGLAFSKVKPRRGRFAKIAPAILLYVLYANGLFLARAWLTRGIVPAVLGFWWIHALMLILALVLLTHERWQWIFVRRRGSPQL